MGKKLSLLFLALGVLLFMGASCSNEGTSLYVQNSTSLDTGGTDSPSTVSGWRTYENKKYGVSFDYPSNWFKNESVSDDFLSVKLGNADCIGVQCPPDFLGIEIRAGIKKNTTTNFIAWIDSKIDSNNKTGLLPNGKRTSVNIGGRSAIKVEKSDWAGAVPGPAYFINQDQDYYIYISIGRNDLTDTSLNLFNRIIGSMKFFANELPAVDSDQGDETVNSNSNNGGVIKPTGQTYINERFKFKLIYPNDCLFKNNSDQVYPPVDVELFVCGKDADDKTVGLRITSSTIAQESERAFNGRKLKYFQSLTLLSDHKSVYLTFYKGTRNKPERYIFAEKNNRVYVFFVTNDTGDYIAAFDKMIAGFEFVD